MDREQLYQNLAELEKQLQKVKSANEQVDGIIASDRQLVDGIKEYIAMADSLLAAVKSAYDEAAAKINEQAHLAVKETVEGLAVEYRSEVKSVRSEYTASMKESVDLFESVVDKEKSALESKVSALTQLVDEKLIPLRDSLSSIVDGRLAKIPEEFGEIINDSKSTLDSSASALKDASDIVSKECRVMVEKVEALPVKIEEASEEIISALAESKKMFLEKLFEGNSTLTSAIKEQSSHMDGRLDGIEKALDTGISKVDGLLSDGFSKTEARVDSLERNLYAMGEKAEASVTAAISEQSGHVVEELDSIGKALDAGISKAHSSLSADFSKADAKVEDLGRYLSALQERIEGLEKSSSFIKALSIIILVLSAALLILRFV